MGEQEQVLREIWKKYPRASYLELVQILDNRTNKMGGSIFPSHWTSVKKGYNETSNKSLRKYGDKRIIALNVYRTPLSKIATTLLNIGSFGAYGRAKEELNYDKLFHLALVATVDDNGIYKNVILEKDPKISISTHYPTNENTETHPVNLHGKKFTIIEMTESLRRKLGDDEYFSYSAFQGRNCQNYILGLLEVMDLLNESLTEFIYQDLTKLKNKLPSYVPALSDKITNLGAISHQILGKGYESSKSEIMKKLNKNEKINIGGRIY